MAALVLGNAFWTSILYLLILCLVFTGMSEMFKTPVSQRKRKSVMNESSAMKTPAASLGTSLVEPSVLNTPEEPGKVCDSIVVGREPKNKISILYNHQN